MNISRRKALGIMAGALPAAASLRAQGALAAPEIGDRTPPGIGPESGPFKGSRDSLKAYQPPDWFRDAKFGMWAHWGPQSAVEFGDWYARLLYIQGSEQYDYHCEHYGHPSKFGMKDTIPFWKAEKFDPAHLIKLYKAAGARYFMTMGVHHDNFDLWNSKFNRWNAAAMGPKIDIVGAWRKAVRDEGLKFAVSEHLWITYKWYSVAHGADATGPWAGVPYDGAGPGAKDLYVDSDQVWSGDLPWNEDGIPNWWKRHWHDRITDLIDQHEPDLVYSDGSLPFQEYGYSVVSHLYNTSIRRNGGRNEAVYFSKREEDSAAGLCVLDKERSILDDILPRPWQTDTCIGNWHYKRGMRYKTPKMVIDMLVDVVSKNGNLMLNIPLPASGQPDIEELAIVDEITKWMAVNSEGIHGTRPWKKFGEGAPVQSAEQSAKAFNEGSRRAFDASDVRFTTKGDVLYAFVMGKPEFRTNIRSLATDTALAVGRITGVELLGYDGRIEWSQDSKGLAIAIPAGDMPTKHAVAFRIRGA
ncbi:MAG TPA: alpha-L-fucosidase [Opitutaceae bacterium]|jgi:alpha-L-fucosidase